MKRSANSSSGRGAWKRRCSSSNQNSRAGRAATCPLRQKQWVDVKVLAAQIEGADAKALRDAVDQLKSQARLLGHRACDRSGWQSGAGGRCFRGFGGDV